VQGPAGDLHSGMFGGTVINPANELARLIGGMHDGNGRITLPGFYDSVRAMDKKERKALAELPMDEDYYLDLSGAPSLHGEKGFTPVERVGGRPSLDVNGFLSGYTGEGGKTVLPAKAMAKISMRLVPDQDPKEVHQQLLQYLLQLMQLVHALLNFRNQSFSQLQLFCNHSLQLHLRKELDIALDLSLPLHVFQVLLDLMYSNILPELFHRYLYGRVYIHVLLTFFIPYKK